MKSASSVRSVRGKFFYFLLFFYFVIARWWVDQPISSFTRDSDGTTLFQNDLEIVGDERDTKFPLYPVQTIHFGAPVAKRRVCFLSPGLRGPQQFGGIAAITTDEAILLGKNKNLEVTVLYGQIPTANDSKWITEFGKKNVELVYLDKTLLQETRAGDWNLRRSYVALRWLQKQMLENRPCDVILAIDMNAMAYFATLFYNSEANLSHVPIITHSHASTLMSAEFGGIDQLSYPKARLHQYEKEQIERSDIVTSPSRFYLHWMTSRNYTLSNAYLLPNIVNDFVVNTAAEHSPAAQRYGKIIKSTRIVLFSRLDRLKGVFFAMECFLEMSRRGIKMPSSITFIGDPVQINGTSSADILRTMALALPRSVTVDFIHNANTSMATEHMLRLGGFLLLPTFGENAPLAAYESALQGIPIIASRGGGQPEVLHPYTLTFSPGDHEDCIRSIQYGFEHGVTVYPPRFSPRDNELRFNSLIDGTFQNFHRDSTQTLCSECITVIFPISSADADLPTVEIIIETLMKPSESRLVRRVIIVDDDNVLHHSPSNNERVFVRSSAQVEKWNEEEITNYILFLKENVRPSRDLLEKSYLISCKSFDDVLIPVTQYAQYNRVPQTGLIHTENNEGVIIDSSASSAFIRTNEKMRTRLSRTPYARWLEVVNEHSTSSSIIPYTVNVSG